ncbi:hypothetical protein J2S43_007841 [Catenuloplanes nepalensis]|uniref:Uncharacterized protein n=1 Tax=Catenuloplanes nepalensis TaxID=587533 RepID=A0ABT9N6K6_9ACTN|nr:hypothetical protein [Catenuloplanes nepalensis]MDP9799329.1 hypothetical protein [Catenuloplanes nepalensis]
MRGWTTYATVLAPPHEPMRPSWLCAQDGMAWPCGVARTQLAASVHPADLGTTLVAQLERAARDMPDSTPDELYERFIAWTLEPAC